MKALLIFKDDDRPEGWGERYDNPACKSEAEFVQYAKAMASRFNGSLRGHELPRTFVRVEELTEGKHATAECPECKGTGQNDPHCDECDGEGFDDEGNHCDACGNEPCPFCIS